MADNRLNSKEKLIECFVEDGSDFRMRPAPLKRSWMDDSPDRFAYRCLPLAIANAHGWELLNTSRFQAKWTGGRSLEDIIFATPDGKQPPLATSHFGEGILTFHIPCLFRTPPGYDLWVMGPTNEFKEYIQALNALVETDWSPYTFTMNWKFTTSDAVVTFEEDEPIATIFPVKRGEIETFQPIIRRPSDAPQLWAEFNEWSASRNNFNNDLKVPGSEARSKKWQKAYMNGPDKTISPPHRSKIRVRDFPTNK